MSTLRRLFLFFVASSSTAATRSSCLSVQDLLSSDGYIEVLDSPVLKGSGDRELRLVWRVRPRLEGDKALLYEKGKEAPLFTSTDTANSFLDTGITRSPKAIYHAKYLRSNGTVAAQGDSVKKTDWMYCIRDKISRLKLNQVFLPGSHNAASYLPPKDKPGRYTVLNKFVYNQDESVLDQLERGSRYLDLRVGFYPDENYEDPWWINHDLVRVYPLTFILDQIKSFMNRSDEIVVLDFHNFPVGFKEGHVVHKMLAKRLQAIFKDHLHPPCKDGWSESLGDVWASGRRLVVSYNNPQIAPDYGFFSPVQQIWSNSLDPEQLYTYLNSRIPKSWDLVGGEMKAAMAELTPNLFTIMMDLQGGGLRKLADLVNVNVTLGLVGDCWGDRSQAVAVDFLSTTGVVSAAIRSNLRRAEGRPRRHSDPPCDILKDLCKYHRP